MVEFAFDGAISSRFLPSGTLSSSFYVSGFSRAAILSADNSVIALDGVDPRATVGGAGQPRLSFQTRSSVSIAVTAALDSDTTTTAQPMWWRQRASPSLKRRSAC